MDSYSVVTSGLQAEGRETLDDDEPAELTDEEPEWLSQQDEEDDD